MSDLTIRRNRGFSAVRYPSVGKSEKTSAGGEIQKAVRPSTGLSVSRTLEQLAARVSQAENGTRESRRALQTGESVLAEVQDRLGRMAQLLREAAGDAPGRAALQKELETLAAEIERMARTAAVGDTPLFRDGEEDGGESMEALLLTAASEDAPQELVQELPGWLMKAFVMSPLSPADLLAALGLDSAADSGQVLSALAANDLDSNPAAAYLAALYLGSVISGSSDPDRAMEGFELLLEQIAQGVPPDEALELLTDGAFTSFADFQEQFTAGTAPGLEEFLTELLLTNNSEKPLTDAALLALLGGVEQMQLDLIMGLLDSLGGLGSGLELLNPDTPVPLDNAPLAQMDFGEVQVLGRDLSGVSYDPSTGLLTIGGTADVTVRGGGQTPQAVALTGSGTVTLRDMAVSVLTVEHPETRLSSAGEVAVEELVLHEKAALTLGGNGFLDIGQVHAHPSAALRLIEGVAVTVGAGREEPGKLTIPVTLDGPAFLAAQADQVSGPGGVPLEPFDLVWKALLPGWSGITSAVVDGTKLTACPDPARLWLQKGDHGYTVHVLAVRGKDPSGKPKTRYAYLLWNQQTGKFREIAMYPNPFTITGGKAGKDWVYEEGTHTLRILSDQVSAIAGGVGTDALQAPFSGRLALADGIGAMELSLGGVVCRVPSGVAFDLGEKNDVTLVVQDGADNLFESGTGCAGIALGSETTLRIDCEQPPRGGTAPAGALTATGGAGGQGIGPESEQVMVRGGVVTADGTTWNVKALGGGRKRWTRAGIALQMGADTVTLPRFPLSSKSLGLDDLSLTTRECIKAAQQIIEADRRRIAQMQNAYAALYQRLEKSITTLRTVRRDTGRERWPVRDAATAGILLNDMRHSILIQSAGAMYGPSQRDAEDVRQLLR